MISLCETVERSYSEKGKKKTHSKNPGCLTATHANTAIIGGRKLDSVAVTNSLVNWNKALCCYVKVSACNCGGCFEGFIIYIFLRFFFFPPPKESTRLSFPSSRGGGVGAVWIEGAERCLTRRLYNN